MKVLVVYDSVFGNTKKVAEGIRDAFEVKEHVVELRSVKEGNVPKFEGVDMVVIGSPTRGFQPTKETKAFIKSIDNTVAKRIKFAIFDTRMDVVKVDNKALTFMEKIFGYADSTMVKLITRKGGRIVGKPKGFFVEDSEGPLMNTPNNQPEVFVEELLS